MKRKFVIVLSLLFFLTFTLLAALPVMANEPLEGIQLALSGVSADDANAAADQEAVKAPKETTDVQETKAVEAPPVAEPQTPVTTQEGSAKSIEQELKDLKEEIQKLRGENEARKKLEIPEEEKSQTIDDILSAAGRQYSLLKKGTVGLSYTFNYAYYSGDAIDESTTVLRRVNHNLTNTLALEYAFFNNLTVSSNFPFVYKYNKVGTDESLDVTDLGDISIGFSWQPFKAGGRIPTTILSLSLSLPTGSSPFEINYEDELATGAGYYGIGAGVSFSKVLDPLVAFGNLNYTYGIPESGLSQILYEDPSDPASKIYLEKVEPGSSIGVSMGFGYALSYQASLNMSAQFSYSFGSKYKSNTGTTETGSSLSSSFNVGTGWRITPSRSIYATVSMGLTNNDPDVSLSLRLPYEF